jgi:hypothetical protein
MPLSHSWKMHFLQGLVPLNAISNRNVKKYLEAMPHDATVDTKMKYLSKDHNFILIADNKKQVTILHNLKNYGGTMLQSTNKVAALFGIGPDAQVVALNASAAIATQYKHTQSAANIIAAANTGTNSLRALQTPTHGDVNYKGISMFTPAPFLQNGNPQSNERMRTRADSTQETLKPTATYSSRGAWQSAKNQSPRPATHSSQMTSNSKSTK